MSDKLRVVTYNVHSCVGGDRRYDPARTLEVLREIDADIIALQEVGGRLADGMEQAHFFERMLGMAMVAGPNLHRRNIPYGNALLVKGTICDADLLDLTILPFEARGAIDCVVETRGGIVRVIATHLGLFARERRRQIDRLADRLQEKHKPLTLFLGDFNIFGPERTILRRIGAPKRLPKLYSFPARRPLMSLDRAWAIPNEHMIEVSVYRTPVTRLSSDHLPLVGIVDRG